MATPGSVSDAVASDDVVTVLSATALVPVGVARSEQGSANRRKGRGSQGCCTRFIDYSIHKIFLPGTKLSRARYELLRSGPVALCLALLFLPTVTGGELNGWLYLVFQAAYAVSPGVFALAAYALLYSLPSQVSCALVIAGALAVHTALSGIAVATFSGRALAFALPAALVVSAVIILAFLAGATVKSIIYARMKAGSSGGDKLPSMCSLLCSMKYQPNNQHSNGPVQGLLNLDAMVPFRRLLSAFCVLLAAYYWCQVYTTTLTSDLIAWLGEGSSWSFIVVLLFDLSMRVATYVVGEVTKPSRLVKSGVGADSAQTVHTVFKQALTLLGMVYQRFLFLNFTTVSSVSIAVMQRLVLEIITGPGFMTRRFRSFLVELKRVLAMLFGKLEPVPPYAEYLQAALRDNMYKKIAEFTSLLTWLASLLWLRVGYNSAVYPYSEAEVPTSSLELYIQYAVLFVVAEIPILFLTRGLAAANNVQFFDAAVQVVFHCPAGVIAYVAVCTHVLQDVYVAETAVEPNSFQ